MAALTPSKELRDPYEDVLKSYTQSFHEDDIDTEYLRGPRPEDRDALETINQPLLQPASLPERIPETSQIWPASLIQENPVEKEQARPASRALSNASSSSGLTYIDVDYAHEAEQQRERQEIAQPTTVEQPTVARPSLASTTTTRTSAAFHPILPHELTSRQPTPRPSRASNTTTIPSPFLAATHLPSRGPSPESERRGSRSKDAQRERRSRSDSLEPPRIDLGSPFAALPPAVREQENELKGKGKELKVEEEEQLDEWTKKFVEADRKLKFLQGDRVPTTRARNLTGGERDVEMGSEREGKEPTPEGKARDEEEDLVDPSQLGTRREPRQRTPSPTLASSSSPHSSPSPIKRKRAKPTRTTLNREKKRPRVKNRSVYSGSDEGSEHEQSMASSDRNMTVEKSLSTLPKSRRLGKRAKGIFRGIYSDIGEVDEGDEEGEEVGQDEDGDEDELTDYDEPVSTSQPEFSRKRKEGGKSSTKAKSKTAKKRTVASSSPDMVLGDRTNRAKWREIDNYKLETVYTL
ncbi:hypothetical protein JCM16303_001992 [Sporobolomyces ruberrimus]